MKISRSSFAGDLSLYDSREAAQFLGVTTQTICTWARAGRLDGQLCGSGWFFTQEALENFLQGKAGRRGSRRGSRRAYTPREDPADRYGPDLDGFFSISKR